MEVKFENLEKVLNEFGKAYVETIKRLTEEEGIKELARLLGSGTLSDAAIENAKEMRRNARERV